MKNIALSLAQSLQEYATNIPLSEYEQPQQFYMDLAWSRFFTIFTPITPFDTILSGSDQARIHSTKTAEMNNSYYNGINPSGSSQCP